MKCPKCGSNELTAAVYMRLWVKLDRTGSIKPPKISVQDVKDVWEQGEVNAKVVVCDGCQAEYRLVGTELRTPDSLDTE